MWSNVDTSNLESKIDKNKLEDLFSARDVPKKLPSTPSSKEPETVISSSRLRNIEILLKQFKNVEDLSVTLPQWIHSLNTKEITPEKLSALEIIAPTPEEQSQYLNYPKKSELQGVDKLLLSIVCVPKFRSKLRLIRDIHSCEFNNHPELQNIMKMKNEIFQLLQGSKFSQVLEFVLIIGNTMNSGKRTGNAKGFKIDILPLLSQTKSIDKKSTLMDFLVICCKKENIDNFWVEMDEKFSGAMKLSIEEIEVEVSKVAEIWNHFKEELENSQNYSEESVGLISQMERVSMKDFEMLNESCELMKKNFQQVLAFFGEESQKDSDFLKIMKNFMLDFKSSSNKI
jgi:hypothetical protein